MNKHAALTNLRRNIAGLQKIADDMQASIDAEEGNKSLVDSHPENVPTMMSVHEANEALRNHGLNKFPELNIRC